MLKGLSRAENSPQRWNGIQALFFLTADDGWLVDLDDDRALRLSSTIYKTVDGGREWKTVGHLPFPPSRIRFIVQRHGWLTSASANGVAATTDGGVTWKTFSPAALLSKGQGMSSGEDLVALSNESVWAVLKNQLLTTSDGGVTWKRDSFLLDVRGVSLVSDGVGFALDARGWIFRTDDNGIHWARIPSAFFGAEQTLNDMPRQNISGRLRFNDDRHGWLVLWAAKRANAMYFRTDDGGRSWHEQRLEGVPLNEDALVYDLQLQGHSGWMIANTLPGVDGIQRYYVLKLDDGHWVSCASADTLTSVRMFTGVPPEFVFVLEGRTKLVKYEGKKD
jgi:photosystem II stability/assembly factor-like uncharacterized protein